MSRLAVILCLLFAPATLLAPPPAHAAPLSEPKCRALAGDLATDLDISPGFRVTPAIQMELTPLPTQDVCRMLARMPGSEFEKPTRVGLGPAAAAMRIALFRQGWSGGPRATRLAADGPLGSRFGVEKSGALCAVTVALSSSSLTETDGPVDLEALSALPPHARRYSLELLCIAA